MRDHRDIHAQITNQIVALLEKGVQPWFQSWVNREVTRPLRVTGQPYHGVNALILWMTAAEKGYSNPYWMTFRQAKAFGANVKRGAKGTMVVFTSKITRKDKETDEDRVVSFLRAYTVFNCDQIENVPAKFLPEAKPEQTAEQRIAAAETFFANLGMNLRHGGGRAFFHPAPEPDDYVQMPVFSDFRTPEDYYCTLAHEATHWTKLPTRLDRDLGKKQWGDEGYAMEELVAELGSAFLAADLGITPQPREDHASYIASWLKVLASDKRAIFSAASHADRAVAYLHARQPGHQAEAEAEAEAEPEMEAA